MSRFRKPALQGFEPYVPGIQPPDGEEWVKLNTNESPFPPAPGVREAIDATVDRLPLYPDPGQTAFREAVAEVLDVRPEMVVAGNGADEVLAMAVRAYVPAGGTVAYLEPSYTLVPKLCAINEVVGEEHPYTDDYLLPRSLIESTAALKIVTNPNSPTGTLVPLSDIADLCRASPGVVLLDEAYVDFAPTSGLELLDAHENLLLVRTMSKSYSLAGLRVGYAVGAPELVKDLWAVKDICNVGRLPLAAGAVAIKDRKHWRRGVDDTIFNRQRLTADLTARGWRVLPSGSNFIFAVPPVPAAEVYEHLLQRKVLVRYFARPSVSHGLRISIGTRAQCQALLDAMQA
ncbi:MAG: pyridoxal phosphate-dependent aminotransferase [Candidatus Dormibacteria bacterium]